MEIRQAAAAMTLKRHLAETARAQMESLTENLSQSREELLETTLRLKTILEAAPVGILITNADFQIESINRCAQTLFGLEPEEAEGKSLSSLLSVARLSAGNFSCSGQHRDQTDFPAQLSVSQLRLESALLHICIVVDKTESQRMDSERSRLEARLLQAKRTNGLGNLAGRLADEFNRSLETILAQAESALLETSLDGVRDRLVQIQAIAISGLALSNQMHSFSGKAAQSQQSLSLNDLIRNSVGLLKEKIPSCIDLNLELAERLPQVKGDPDLLQQVVVNLVLNAVEAVGQEQGSIRLSTGVKSLDRNFLNTTIFPEGDTGTYVWLACHDSGRGLDSATLERIFDPFFTTRSDGQGLGLSSVLGIVKGHLGNLRVESKPGEGSTFWIYLPASQLPPLKTPSRPRNADQKNSDKDP